MGKVFVMETKMSEEEILQKRYAIKGFLEQAEASLEKAQLEGKLEAAASYQYLVGEYQTMLEEFEEYYGL